jgi:hypothetical protein
VRDLLFIGIESEIQREGVWVEWKEKKVTYVAGMASFNKNNLIILRVLCNLFSRVCVRIFTFPANCVSQYYSASHTVYLDQP